MKNKLSKMSLLIKTSTLLLGGALIFGLSGLAQNKGLTKVYADTNADITAIQAAITSGTSTADVVSVITSDTYKVNGKDEYTTTTTIKLLKDLQLDSQEVNTLNVGTSSYNITSGVYFDLNGHTINGGCEVWSAQGPLFNVNFEGATTSNKPIFVLGDRSNSHEGTLEEFCLGGIDPRGSIIHATGEKSIIGVDNLKINNCIAAPTFYYQDNGFYFYNVSFDTCDSAVRFDRTCSGSSSINPSTFENSYLRSFEGCSFNKCTGNSIQLSQYDIVELNTTQTSANWNEHNDGKSTISFIDTDFTNCTSKNTLIGGKSSIETGGYKRNVFYLDVQSGTYDNNVVGQNGDTTATLFGVDAENKYFGTFDHTKDTWHYIKQVTNTIVKDALVISNNTVYGPIFGNEGYEFHFAGVKVTGNKCTTVIDHKEDAYDSSLYDCTITDNTLGVDSDLGYPVMIKGGSSFHIMDGTYSGNNNKDDDEYQNIISACIDIYGGYHELFGSPAFENNEITFLLDSDGTQDSVIFYKNDNNVDAKPWDTTLEPTINFLLTSDSKYKVNLSSESDEYQVFSYQKNENPNIKIGYVPDMTTKHACFFGRDWETVVEFKYGYYPISILGSAKIDDAEENIITTLSDFVSSENMKVEYQWYVGDEDAELYKKTYYESLITSDNITQTTGALYEIADITKALNGGWTIPVFDEDHICTLTVPAGNAWNQDKYDYLIPFFILDLKEGDVVEFEFTFPADYVTELGWYVEFGFSELDPEGSWSNYKNTSWKSEYVSGIADIKREYAYTIAKDGIYIFHTKSPNNTGSYAESYTFTFSEPHKTAFNIDDWTPIEGANKSSLSLDGLKTGSYFCKITYTDLAGGDLTNLATPDHSNIIYTDPIKVESKGISLVQDADFETPIYGTASEQKIYDVTYGCDMPSPFIEWYKEEDDWTGTAPTGMSLVYENDVITLTTTALTPAGSYKFRVNNGGEGDAMVVTEATIVVAKKEVTVTWTNTSLTYTGEAQSPTVTVSGLVNGDTLSASITGGSNTNVGTYPVDCTISSTNYVLSGTTSSSYTISKKTLTMEASIANYALGATGAPAVVVTGNESQTYTVEYKKSGSADSTYTTDKPADFGGYVARITVSNDNYTGSTTCDFSVLHNYSDTWSKDSEKHWHACTDDGYSTLKIDEEEHTFGAVVVVTPATVDAAGTGTRTCSVCGKEIEVEIPKLEHVYAETWTKDANHHWHDCTLEGHTDAGDVAEHTFGDWSVVTEATYAAAGLKKRTCSVCGYEASEVIPMLVHNYSTEWSTNEASHYHACTDTGYTSLAKDLADHTFVNGVCSTCGFEEVITGDAHNFDTEWTYDEQFHWHACLDEDCTCGSNIGAHTWNSDNVCSVCGFEKPADFDGVFTLRPIVEQVEGEEQPKTVDVAVDLNGLTKKEEDASKTLELKVDLTDKDSIGDDKVSSYKNNEKIALERQEVVSAIYDVKLLLDSMEIQPNDLDGENKVITVKMKVPESVATTLFRLVHIHDLANNDVDVLERVNSISELAVGSYYLDGNGYVITKLDKLSEISFITANEKFKLSLEESYFHYLMIAILILGFMGLGLFFGILNKAIISYIWILLLALASGYVYYCDPCEFNTTFLLVNLVDFFGVAFIILASKGQRKKTKQKEQEDHIVIESKNQPAEKKPVAKKEEKKAKATK